MSSPHVITLGCRLNTLESEIMRTQAAKAGLDDTIIVNTCAVTAEAERQGRQTIRRLRRDYPDKRIIVTGCAAQLNPEEFAAMDEVDRVVGNLEKMDAAQLTDLNGPAVAVSDIMVSGQDFDVPMISGFEERTRAFVQVQQGCDHRCTFCIIPFARGPNRSVQPGRIIEQVRALTQNGHIEVVLTGVDVSSYGQDDADLPALGALARQILDQVHDLKRLRITSLDPAFIDDGIFALLADEPRFMPHLHLSLQAADDMVLKRMKRRHSRQQAIDLVNRARAARPDAVFGADLIAGFPTETEAMFENTLNGVAEMGLTYLHVFPYSNRPGT
ncbi:MAG: tRNA (N(6)-L-threonylcarbamoyladenosine(37)-C(2))-methylthiotransferase MtaB, partial [Rhodospirillales bacterium]|nr:tRNA (N(6)-L-threonylcarbamoyladenosine(37)-C(2))-methylthiotransferase MtaB [Rhodospirillales bacterium]